MNKLSSVTVRLLSSSQVVTSVSSAVKELVENALDAGATSLDVKLEKWGLDKIEVRDNGCGINQSDTNVMAQRSYTSKISKHEDLQSLDTYGFRGEALGSLCQVADVCITTKTVEDAVAVSYTLDQAGQISSKKPTHDGVGTTVVACNLFKNLPVRKQFYNNAKKCKEELKKIEDILMAYGLINPELRVTLKNNKNLVWQKNKSCDIKTAMMDVFGIHVFNQLDYFEYVDNGLPITLKGFVPKIDSNPKLTSRSSEERCFIFVNKRYVVWKELLQVLKKHCVWKSMESSEGKFPLCFISLHLSSQDIDANLEPNKTTVLIKDKEEVLEIISDKLCKMYKSDSDKHVPECVKEIPESNISDKLCKMYKSDSDEHVPECVKKIPESNVSDHSSSNGITKSGLNKATLVHDSSEGLMETNPINFGERSPHNHSSEKESVDRDVQVIVHENEAGISNTNDVLQQNDFSEVDTDCLVASNRNGCIVDNSSQQNDVITNKTGSVLQYNICSETIKDNSSSKYSVKDDGGREERRDAICSGRTEQSDLDELLGDLVNDLNDLDDTTFFQDSTQPNLDQWSKGKGVCDKNGKDVEPVRLLMPCQSKTGNEKRASTSSLNGKRKLPSDQDSSSPKSSLPSKRIKKFAKISGQPLLTSVLQSPKTTKPTTSRKITKQVVFSLSLLKQLASDNQKSESTSDEIKLIKRLDPWGVWLISKKRELCILNPYRIQEVLLYKRLLATHVLPREKLGKAIILDERILGSASRLLLLETLVSGKKDSGNVQFCDDERIVSNGFEISGRFDPESGKTRLDLIKMNTTIPYFGVRDLIEVLDLIKDNENLSLSIGINHCALASCRSSKVCNFFKDEVVRISRGLTSRMTESDIDVILKNMKEELTHDETTCIHNQPFLYSLTSY